MKRSPLLRKSSPRRSRAPRARHRPPRIPEAGRDEWKERKAGWCESCDRFALYLHHHHVYPERLVRLEGGDPWAARNGMRLCERCHMNHHAAFRRVPLERVPPGAVAFCVALIGEDRADLFFERFYAPRDGRRVA